MLNTMLAEIISFERSSVYPEIKSQINNEYMELIADVLSPDPALRDMKDYNAGRAAGLARSLALIETIRVLIEEDIKLEQIEGDQR